MGVDEMLNYREFEVANIEYEIGFRLGLAESNCNLLFRLNRLKDVNVEELVNIIGEGMPMEQYHELMLYRKSYPSLSTRKLLQKLAKESEYKYL